MSSALILLAAGESLRMGRPKQLLAFGDKTLLRRAVDSAIASHCQPVIVVIGAHAEVLQAELVDLPVTITVNTDWSAGMGTSIAAGMETVRSVAPEANAVIIMLCDQPLVSVELLSRMIELHAREGSTIVASEYNGVVGVPALFDRQVFGELSHLAPAEGARHLIARHQESVARISFPLGAVDIDTPADYDRAIRDTP